MAFMIPVAQYFTVDEAREYYVEPCIADGGDPGEPEAGWYGYLTAPGYLDRTEYDGPYETEDEAFYAVLSFYEIDADGNDLDGVKHYIEIRPNGDPYGSGYEGSETRDGGESWVYRGDVGAQSLSWWVDYCDREGIALAAE